MIKGKTKSGFEFKISEEIANDYELVELLGELEENALVLTTVVTKVLGKEQATTLKNHLRNDNGVVPTDAMMQEVMEIFSSRKEIKN